MSQLCQGEYLCFTKSHKFRCWSCKTSGAPSTCETSQAQGRCDCCLWQAFWGENGHLCNCNDWILTCKYSIWVLHPDAVSDCLSLLLSTDLLKNLEIGQGGKECMKTQQGSCQLALCSTGRGRAGLVVVLQSSLPITDAVMVEEQFQPAGHTEILNFPGDALEWPVYQVGCPLCSF